MTTFLLTPIVASVATLVAAKLWCRGSIALIATGYGSAALFVAVRVLA